MILIAIAISLISAMGWHSALKNYWLACVFSATTSAVLVWVVAQSHVGWLSVEMLYIGGLAFVVAGLVGLVFHSRRVRS